jgi:hypothetical protein
MARRLPVARRAQGNRPSAGLPALSSVSDHPDSRDFRGRSSKAIEIAADGAHHATGQSINWGCRAWADLCPLEGDIPVIADAIEFIRKEVRDHLGVADDEVIINSARKLVEEQNPPGAYISVVNVEEEPALRNLPHVERRLGQSQYVEPPVFLNLSLLFAFEFLTYSASLVHLGKTVELFQTKRWFGAATQSGPGANAFPASLEKLVFEMVNMNFEELNNLWGVLGGAYFPSVVYKVRMVRVQFDAAAPAPEITTIRLDTVIP